MGMALIYFYFYVIKVRQFFIPKDEVICICDAVSNFV
jgi:hypothetical protein